MRRQGGRVVLLVLESGEGDEKAVAKRHRRLVAAAEALTGRLDEVDQLPACGMLHLSVALTARVGIEVGTWAHLWFAAISRQVVFWADLGRAMVAFAGVMAGSDLATLVCRAGRVGAARPAGPGGDGRVAGGRPMDHDLPAMLDAIRYVTRSL